MNGCIYIDEWTHDSKVWLTDTWKNEWMDRWVDGWMKKGRKEEMNEWMNKWMDRCMDKERKAEMNEWMDDINNNMLTWDVDERANFARAPTVTKSLRRQKNGNASLKK